MDRAERVEIRDLAAQKIDVHNQIRTQFENEGIFTCDL